MDRAKNFNVLKYLRVLACVLVVREHYVSQFHLPDAFGRVIYTGPGPVVIFFVISGFLAFNTIDKRNSIKLYYLQRAIRIIPTYYCVLFLCIVVNYFIKIGTRDLGILNWIRYATFTNMLLPSYNFNTYNNLFGFWTMGCFPMFYLLAPWIKKLMTNSNRVISILVASIVLNYIYKGFINLVFGVFGFDSSSNFGNLNPFSTLYLFILGMVSAYAYIHSEEKKFAFLYAILILAMLMLGKSGYILWGCTTALIVLLPDIGKTKDYCSWGGV